MHHLITFFRPTGLLVAIMVSATTALAQTDPTDGGPAPDPDPTAVPIDGGASLLLAAGVGLGVRHLRRRKQSA